jgi:hypothetical protein
MGIKRDDRRSFAASTGEHAGHGDHDRIDDAGFIEERGFGHIPGQRWSGGYGGDQDHGASGRGFPGSDFEGSHRADDGRDVAPSRGVPPTNVRGPHWGKGPKGYERSDDRTREEVCEAIAEQGLIDASDVEVAVSGGIVTLSGTVAQRHHKRALELLVEQVRGVDEVYNELRLTRRPDDVDPATGKSVRG